MPIALTDYDQAMLDMFGDGIATDDELRDMFGSDIEEMDTLDTAEHWHIMVSLPGCLPDAHDTYDTRDDAISGICDTYPEYAGKLRRRLSRGESSVTLSSLHRPYGYYVELFACSDSECAAEHDGY